LTDYELPTINVAVIGSQGEHKIVKCKVDQHKALIKDSGVDYTVSFSLNNVKPMWVKVLFGWSWKPGIYWVAGTNQALDIASSGEFLPPLTQKDNAAFVEKTEFEKRTKPTKKMTDIQFLLLLLGIAIVAGIGIMNLFGVHISFSTAHSTAKAVVSASPTPSPIAILP